MKTYLSVNNIFTGIGALICAVSGCTQVETESGQEVPLAISASFPALSAGPVTRAATSQVNIALNATAGAYASEIKTYNVTSSTDPITFAPTGTGLSILNSAIATPLTIYGWLDDNTPVCYSNSSVAVSNGSISNIVLSPAYACVGVRILKDGQTGPADTYSISSERFNKGIGTSGENGGWDTSQQMPKLNNYVSPGSANQVTFKNTDKATVVGLTANQLTSGHFTRVAPGNLNTASTNLFEITLPNGEGTLKVPTGAGNEPEYKAGYCYLFTVNISRNASIEISSIEQYVMPDKTEILVLGPDKQPGIFSKQDLLEYRDAINEGYGVDRWEKDNVVNLYTDIDLQNADWTPIGNQDSPYTGKTFKGNGFTISNLNVPVDKKRNSTYGLFGYLDRGTTIKGLTIDGAILGTSANRTIYAGVIAGEVNGGASIIDCHVKGKVVIYGNVQDNNSCAGGIAGYVFSHNNHPPLIAACTVQNNVDNSSIEAYYAGGIAGKDESQPSSIIACIAHDMKIADRQVPYVAGIAYKMYDIPIWGCVTYRISAKGQMGSYGLGPAYLDRSFFTDFSSIRYPDEVSNTYERDWIVGYIARLNDEDIIKLLNESINEWQKAWPKVSGSDFQLNFHFEASDDPQNSGPVLVHGKIN